MIGPKVSGSRRSCPVDAGTARAGTPPAELDVVVPCFNEDPPLLRCCLEALAAQRYEGSIRVWMVDDGSSNWDVLEPVYCQFKQRDGWELVRLPNNLGKRWAQCEATPPGQGRAHRGDRLRHRAAARCP